MDLKKESIILRSMQKLGVVLSVENVSQNRDEMTRPQTLICPECNKEKPYTSEYWPRRSGNKWGLVRDRCWACHAKKTYKRKYCEFCGDVIMPFKLGKSQGSTKTCSKPECKAKRKAKQRQQIKNAQIQAYRKTPKKIFRDTPRSRHGRKCQKCGRPCWPNYFYCQDCFWELNNKGESLPPHEYIYFM